MSQMLSREPRLDVNDVQHFVFEDVSWDFYESVLREIGDRPIRVTYDTGRMEIMSPLPEHERPKKIIAQLIEALSNRLRLKRNSFGGTTFTNPAAGKGLEPDECYYFRDYERVRGKKRLDLSVDPAPELVVEIDITSRSIAREPIYAALGVPEIWRFDGSKLECLHLIEGQYRVRKMSLVFPFLEPTLLLRFIEMGMDEETEMIWQFSEWMQSNGWAQR